MSGQSIADRVMAAKHSLAGQGLAKSVHKATTEEIMGPKKKHLDYLIQCTNEPNVSIPQLANLLIERTQHISWVVVFKSLISLHHLMNYGNERFSQYLASNNCTLNLGSFLDKTGVQGYDMSTYIRRYAKYLNEKAYSYRHMAFDFCKVKRGKEDGLLRTMSDEKLLKALPVLQVQVDALLEFDVTPNELTNGVINAGFMLLFKDLIRLFACYNDGIINLLEKYFDMSKKNCREGFGIYKKFLVRMDKVAEFLKVAENVGIDKGEIPDLAKAPSSLLEALEEHLKALESAKKSGSSSMPKPPSVTSAINKMSAVSASNSTQLTVEDKKRIVEEESRRLEQLKRLKEQEKAAMSPTGDKAGGAATAEAPVVNPFSGMPTQSPTASADLFGAGAGPGAMRPSDDLLALSGPNPFVGSVPQPTVAAVNPFNSPTGAAPGWPNSGQMNGTTANSGAAAGFGTTDGLDFTHAFNNNTGQSGEAMVNVTTKPPPGYDGFGDLMRPATTTEQLTKKETHLFSNDLDTSLASLVGNLNMNGPAMNVKKADHQWVPSSGEKKLTGGSTWQAPMNAPGTGAFGAQAPTAQQGYPMVMLPVNPYLSQPRMFYSAPNSWNGSAGGAMGVPMGQPGYPQQPGGMSFQQPAMGMQAHPAMTAGMVPQQPTMFGAATQGGAFGQPRPPVAQPNDPFGAL